MKLKLTKPTKMDKQLSKEEILAKVIIRFPDDADTDLPNPMLDADIKRNVYKVMDTYAKQTAIGFAEWIKDEYEWSEKINWNCWIPKGVAFIAPTEKLTTEQLYSLYLQSLNK